VDLTTEALLRAGQAGRLEEVTRGQEYLNGTFVPFMCVGRERRVDVLAANRGVEGKNGDDLLTSGFSPRDHNNTTAHTRARFRFYIVGHGGRHHR